MECKSLRDHECTYWLFVSADFRGTVKVKAELRQLFVLVVFQFAAQVELALFITPGCRWDIFATNLSGDITVSLGFMKFNHPSELFAPRNGFFFFWSFWRSPSKPNLVEFCNFFGCEFPLLELLARVADPHSQITLSFITIPAQKHVRARIRIRGGFRYALQK